MKTIKETREISFILKKEEIKKYKTDTDFSIQLEAKFFTSKFKELICPMLNELIHKMLDCPKINDVDLALVAILRWFLDCEKVRNKKRAKRSKDIQNVS